MLPVHRRSLEELRVPACKPYVSPEALARASLEAIQQNPHPLGQQLPNPVAAAAQQHAAMAAMGGPRQGGGGGGMRGGRGMQHHQPPDSGNSSLAPSAAPFVPGGFHPSGALGAVEMQCLCWRGEAASLVAASRPLPLLALGAGANCCKGPGSVAWLSGKAQIGWVIPYRLRNWDACRIRSKSLLPGPAHKFLPP